MTGQRQPRDPGSTPAREGPVHTALAPTSPSLHALSHHSDGRDHPPPALLTGCSLHLGHLYRCDLDPQARSRLAATPTLFLASPVLLFSANDFASDPTLWQGDKVLPYQRSSRGMRSGLAAAASHSSPTESAAHGADCPVWTPLPQNAGQAGCRALALTP